MGQWVTMFAAKPSDLNSILRTDSGKRTDFQELFSDHYIRAIVYAPLLMINKCRTYNKGFCILKNIILTGSLSKEVYVLGGKIINLLLTSLKLSTLVTG